MAIVIHTQVTWIQRLYFSALLLMVLTFADCPRWNYPVFHFLRSHYIDLQLSTLPSYDDVVDNGARFPIDFVHVHSHTAGTGVLVITHSTIMRIHPDPRSGRKFWMDNWIKVSLRDWWVFALRFTYTRHDPTWINRNFREWSRVFTDTPEYVSKIPT